MVMLNYETFIEGITDMNSFINELKKKGINFLDLYTEEDKKDYVRDLVENFIDKHEETMFYENYSREETNITIYKVSQ